MKPKYFGIFSLLALLSSTIGSSVFYMDPILARMPPPANLNLPKPVIVPTPNRSDYERLQTLSQALPSLAQPLSESQALEIPNLSLFSYEPASRQKLNGRRLSAPGLSEFEISMAIVFPRNRYCVINGQFYREGDKLDDKTKIVSIESDRVLLSKQGLSEWYEVYKKNVSNEEGNS